MQRLDDELMTKLRRKAASFGRQFRIPPAEMQDILQDALLAYVAKAHAIQDPDSWFTRVLKNRCANYLRSRAYFRGLQANVAETGKTIEDHVDEAILDLNKLEQGLSSRVRAVIRLTRLGYETQEIAALLASSAEAVRRARNRGKAAMRKALTRSSEDTPCSDPEQDEP